MTDVESGNEVGIDNTDSSSTPTIVSSSEEVDEIIDDAYMLCSFLFLYGCKITCRWDSWVDGGCRFCLSCFGLECEYVARCPVVVHRHLCSSGAVLKYVLPPVLTLCLSYKYKNLQVEIRH